MSLSPSTLQRAMPGLSIGLAEKYTPFLRKAMLEQKITTPKRAAAFLAQLGHESLSLKFFEEIWGPTQAQLGYEGRLDLGNTQAGDGKRFKGRGPIQLTGRANYRKYGKLLGLPLEQNPEMAAKANVGFRTAAMFWNQIGANALADAGDFKGITRRINGGFNGLDDRERRLAAINAMGAASIVPAMSKAEKWREELRKRRAQLTSETEPGARSFLMRRIDQLKRALRRERRKRKQQGPQPTG
jgi:predicted chitinase